MNARVPFFVLHPPFKSIIHQMTLILISILKLKRLNHLGLGKCQRKPNKCSYICKTDFLCMSHPIEWFINYFRKTKFNFSKYFLKKTNFFDDYHTFLSPRSMRKSKMGHENDGLCYVTQASLNCIKLMCKRTNLTGEFKNSQTSPF